MGKFLIHLRRYFIAGLLVVTPLWGTYLVLKTLITALEGILGDVLRERLVFYIPGIGIIVLMTLVLLFGILATNFLGRKLVNIWEGMLRRVPIVRTVFNLVKSIVDTVSLQQTGQFNRVALIQFPRPGIYAIVFVTGTTREVQAATKERVISVFIPTTPNPTSGYLLFVPEHEIIPLSLSVEDATKVLISGGLYKPETAAGGVAAGGGQA